MFVNVLPVIVVLVKPVITGCSAKLYVDGGSKDSERVIASSDCSSESINPVPVWVSSKDLTSIQVIWNSQVTTPSELPSVIYVLPVKVGVAQANFSVDFLSQGICCVRHYNYGMPCHNIILTTNR